MPLPTTHVPLRQNIAGCTPGNYTRPPPIYPLSTCFLSSHVSSAHARPCQHFPALWSLCACVCARVCVAVSWLMHTLIPPQSVGACSCCCSCCSCCTRAVGYRSQASSAHLIPINITRLASPAKHSSPPKPGWPRTNRLLAAGCCPGSRCQLCARDPCSRFPPLRALKSSLLSDVSRHLAGFNMTSNPASPPPVTSPEARRTRFGRPSLIAPRSTGPLAILPNTAHARAHNTDGPWAYVPSFPGASLFLLCNCGAVSQMAHTQVGRGPARAG